MLGVDDSNHFELHPQKENNKTVYTTILNGMTPFSKLLDNNTIKRHSAQFLIGHHKKINLKESPSNVNIFNLIGSPERCSVSLGTLNRIIEKNKFGRVFNHPKKILKTARVQLPETLKDIDGVRLAKVFEVKVNSVESLSTFIQETSLTYPLIIRQQGYHNGKFCKKISSPEDLKVSTEWLNQSLHIIEYIDLKDPEGLYKKARVGVVDGKFYPHHLLLANTWMVNNRDQQMTASPKLRELEHTFLKTFYDDFFKKHETKLQSIHKRLDLDYYGIDCAEDNKGNLVVFEANSCMDMLSYSLGENNEYYYKPPFRAAIKEALENLIQEK